MRPEDRQRIQDDVVTRVVERHVTRARAASDSLLEMLIHDTLYHERLRLERDDPRRPAVRADSTFYQEIRRQLRHASAADLQTILERLARHFVAGVAGNFDERIYRLSTRVLPIGLTVLLSAMSPRRLLELRAIRAGLPQHIRTQGAVEDVRALLDHGTLVVVPTHVSNLDSLLLGYAGFLMGLPPLLYGAGLNLFSNPLFSFFMRNLGAYRVDRRKSAALYKEVLKEYATRSLEMGYHNVFFPGGTRSRSGVVEQRLKKGLLGTAVRAYVENLRTGRPRPNVYIVPCTLSYKLVLEAETLIDDHLKEAGKARYIIEDDEFSRPRRVLQFISNLMSLDAQVVVTFSLPQDVVGNRVDREGHSLDRRGRRVDVRSYVLRHGQPVHDEQRDAEYTHELEAEIRRDYLRDNVLMSTHVVARALLDLLRSANPGMDLYRLLHTGGTAASFPMAAMHAEVQRLLVALQRLPEGPRFGEELRGGDVQEVVADALKHFAIYHTQPAALRHGDRVFHQARRLLLYYANRCEGYDLRAPGS